MASLKNKITVIRFMIFLFLISSILFSCKNKYDDLNLDVYQYRDTKELVQFVYDASLILKKDGLKSLNYFRKNKQKYNTPNHYLYVYDMDGTDLYNAGMEYLEGKNLENITDRDGKKITKLILEALDDKNNPHAWVHYSWWKPGKFYPVPKSSCHFKVLTPEGREIFVGAGLNYPQEEKEFIRIIVDDAALLIRKKGESAFAKISNLSSQYDYRDVKVFAFRADGKILISPVAKGEFAKMQMLKCKDEVGYKLFEEALKKLKTQESVWETFMSKNRYHRELIKKCLYLKKIIMNNHEIYVGAITDLPQPPY